MGTLIQFKYKTVGFIPRRGVAWKAKFNKCLARSYAAAVTHWHAQYREGHFEATANRKYNYTPRKGEAGSGRAWKGSYAAAKKRQKGHSRPLEWSGDLKARSRYRSVKSTKKGGIVSMPTCQKANWRHPKSTINMVAEMTRVVESEADDMIRVQDRRLHTGIQAMHDRQIIIIK